MTTFAEVIESELNDALENKNREAVRRLSFMISERLTRIEEMEKRQAENKSDIKVLAETMKQGFESVHKEMDKRFEGMNRRFTHQTWFIGALIAGINIAIALIKGM
jgi:fructose-1,6-bisphosphatase